MRKAQYKLYVQRLDGNWGYEWQEEALPFHGFFPAGSGEYKESFEIGPVALLEKPDGTMFEVCANSIRFVPEELP